MERVGVESLFYLADEHRNQREWFFSTVAGQPPPPVSHQTPGCTTVSTEDLTIRSIKDFLLSVYVWMIDVVETKRGTDCISTRVDK